MPGCQHQAQSGTTPFENIMRIKDDNLFTPMSASGHPEVALRAILRHEHLRLISVQWALRAKFKIPRDPDLAWFGSHPRHALSISLGLHPQCVELADNPSEEKSPELVAPDAACREAPAEQQNRNAPPTGNPEKAGPYFRFQNDHQRRIKKPQCAAHDPGMVPRKKYRGAYGWDFARRFHAGCC